MIMKATVTTDYKGLNIVVDSQDQEFSRLTIQDLRKCENVLIDKGPFSGSWNAIIDNDIYLITRGKDSHYGDVLYAD